MKDILGHRSWNKQEVIDILLRTGTFTMCNLPHSRYDRVKDICRQLYRDKMIVQSGYTNEAINWKVTEAFRFEHGLDLVT